ncbi:hypothetical protein IFM89_024221 [Coptis chinensis]|uniref:Homeobox domain-containing protein n=1 Tax=Coptis chinensis TaxID=261450 RepID=A0A835LID0_9MAGN|nr:hypothetical protein IFM89_024221 [Coptis chinensis]
MSPAASTRWCPTPEQLMILEEMYRGGIKTPNSTQIQQITAHLSLYGKIEGKNVFYWFQNHKARDRQKLRRKLYCRQQQQMYLHPTNLYHHHLLNHFEAAYNPLGQPFYNYSSLQLLPQASFYEGLVPQEASTQVLNYTRKMDIISPMTEMEKWMKMYGNDSATMTDMVPAPACCSNTRPLKTLQLFPINSTCSLKNDCSTPKSFSCSTTSNN